MSLFDTLSKLFRAPLPDGEKIVLAQKEIESNQNVLVDQMLHIRKRLDPAKLKWFSDEETIDLGVARNNFCIWDRGGRGLFVPEFDGSSANTKIRINDKVSFMYPIRVGYIKGAFQTLYLTNTAQAGKTLKFVVGYRNFAEYMMLGTGNIVKLQDVASDIVNPATTENITTLLQTLMDVTTPKSLKDLWDKLALVEAKTDELPNLVNKATTPILYHVSMTTGNTEYSQTLPDHTKILRIYCKSEEAAFRYAFETGKVADSVEPYGDLRIGDIHTIKGLDLVGKTIYVATTPGALSAKIECWV